PTMNRFTKERLVKPAWGFDPDQAFLAAARAPLALQLRLIDEAVAGGGHLAGPRLRLADLFLLPHLLFLGRAREGAALLDRAPAAADWLARMQARPSYAASPMPAAYEMFHRLSGDQPAIWAAA